MIVVDANAVLYAVLPGPTTDAARAWLAKYPNLFAASLLFDEVRNVLTGYVRRGSLTEAEATTLCAVIRAQVTAVEMTDDGAVIALALETGLSAYDATHVAAAKRMGARLLTGDKKILAACPAVAVDVRVMP